jgi:hypothetical protein
MKIFNEFGDLIHKPTLALSDKIDTLISKHCTELIAAGVSITEIRALGLYFNGVMGLTEALLDARFPQLKRYL